MSCLRTWSGQSVHVTLERGGVEFAGGYAISWSQLEEILVKAARVGEHLAFSANARVDLENSIEMISSRVFHAMQCAEVFRPGYLESQFDWRTSH